MMLRQEVRRKAGVPVSRSSPEKNDYAKVVIV